MDEKTRKYMEENFDAFVAGSMYEQRDDPGDPLFMLVTMRLPKDPGSGPLHLHGVDAVRALIGVARKVVDSYDEERLRHS